MKEAANIADIISHVSTMQQPNFHVAHGDIDGDDDDDDTIGNEDVKGKSGGRG